MQLNMNAEQLYSALVALCHCETALYSRHLHRTAFGAVQVSNLLLCCDYYFLGSE